MSKSETLQDQTTSYLEWMRDTLLPHELQTTTNARRKASLLRSVREVAAELQRRTQ